MIYTCNNEYTPPKNKNYDELFLKFPRTKAHFTIFWGATSLLASCFICCESWIICFMLYLARQTTVLYISNLSANILYGLDFAVWA
jgi:hypothetical protein